MCSEHNGSWCWIRSIVVSGCKCTSGEVYVVTFVFRQSGQILSRCKYANAVQIIAKPSVGEVVAYFDIGNFKIGCILNKALTEHIVCD